MGKIKKSKIIIICTLILSIMIFQVACGNNTKENKEGNENNSIKQNNNNNENEENKEGNEDKENVSDEDENQNLEQNNNKDNETDGNNVNNNQDGEVKLPEIELENPIVTWMSWDTLDQEWLKPILKHFKDEYGGELEVIQTGYEEMPTKLATLVMSGDAPDLVRLRYQEYPNAIINGLVESVGEYFDFESPLWKDIKDLNDKYMWDGKYYLPINNAGANDYVYYNVNLFDENGLDTPRDYYSRGEWNWDTMLELAKELTMDLDFDGTIDVYGYSSTNALPMVMSTGKNFVKIEDNGTIQNNMKDPDIARAINFFQDMTSIKHDVMEPNNMGWKESFLEGKLAMLQEPEWVMWLIADMMKSGEASFVPAPKDPNTSEYILYGDINGMWIGKGAGNIDGAVAYINILRYRNIDEEIKKESNQQFIDNFGFTKEDFDFRDELKSKKVNVPQFYGMGNFGDNQWGMWSQIRDYGIPWATTVEEYYPVLQTEIEKTMEEMKD